MQIKAPGAHIDHMLRQTRMHNMQLSSMADMKASMLLTIASLVMGLSLSQLAISPQDSVFLVLLIASAITIALAIYATMPRIGPRSLFRSKPDTTRPDFTLLFFGDYSDLTYDEFSSEMEAVINDHNLTYESQVKELYNQGRYLANHKFQKLRMAYLAFLGGAVLSAGIVCTRYFTG